MVLNQSNAKPYYKEQGKLYEGQKRYELSNHLGNVLAVINDRKKFTTRGLFNKYDIKSIIETAYKSEDDGYSQGKLEEVGKAPREFSKGKVKRAKKTN